jgi:HSP20 family protein
MLRRDDPGGAVQRRSQGTVGRHQGWDPWRDFDEMNRQMSELFNWALGGDTLGRARGQEFFMPQGTTEPEIDFYETDTEFSIHAALPGVDPKDIHIEATDDTIQMWAETRYGSNGRQFPADNRQSSQNTGTTQTGGGTGTSGSQATGGTQTGTTGSQSTGTTGSQGSGQNVGSGALTGGTMATTESAELQRPVTQHRQSRYSSVSRFQFFYSLPQEIDPNRVAANFRNGMLELHLPKRQQQSSRAIRVPVTATAGQATGTQMGEAGPGAKMGQSYTPSAGEDFTNQPQGPRDRAESSAEHRRGGEAASEPQQGAGRPAGTTTSGTPGSNPGGERR